MDKDYIKLCAEIAYNDILFSETIYEESLILNEGFINTIIEKFLLFVQNIFHKIIQFIVLKLKDLKEKIKIKKRNIKENTSDNKINWDYVFDEIYPILNNLCTEVNVNLCNMITETSEIIESLVVKDIKTVNRKYKDEVISNLDNLAKFEIQIGKLQMQRKILSDETLEEIKDFYNTCIEDSKEKSNYSFKSDNINISINFIDRELKDMEETSKEYKKIINSWKKYDFDSEPQNNIQKILSHAISINEKKLNCTITHISYATGIITSIINKSLAD